MDANKDKFENGENSEQTEDTGASDSSKDIDAAETNNGETITGEEDLLKFFNSLLQNNSKSFYIDEEFESKKLKKNKDVEKLIKEANVNYQMRDADLKMDSRKGITTFLLVILLIQMVFVNLIICWLIVSQTTNLPIFHMLQNEQLSELVTLTKWYATATVAELMSIFIYIVRVLYKKPEIT